MSRKASRSSRARALGAMLTWREVRRRLWLALLIGGAAALIGVVLQNLDRLRGIAPERVVTIFRAGELVSLVDRQGRSHKWLESTSS